MFGIYFSPDYFKISFLGKNKSISVHLSAVIGTMMSLGDILVHVRVTSVLSIIKDFPSQLTFK